MTERIEKLERLIPKLKASKKILPLKIESMEWELRALKAEAKLNHGVSHHVSKPFEAGAMVKITENITGHEFDIDEIVTLVEFKPEYSQWECVGKDGAIWYIVEQEGNVC